MTQWRGHDPEAPATYREAPGWYREARPGLRGSRHDFEDDPYPEDDGRGARRSRGRARLRWGMLPGQVGVCLVIGSAAVGALVTAVLNSDPGLMLGVFLVGGTIVAALAVRPRSGYLIIPVPALAYLVAAVISGLIHDRASDASRATLAINATQWVAGGFTAMAAATVLAILITAACWRRKPQPPGNPAGPTG